jgi:DNA-binding SARP family transcriptional activator
VSEPVRIRLCGQLAVERRHLVATDRIVELLWEERRPRDPAANVATLVSRLRNVLGDGAVAGRRGAYGLLSWSARCCRKVLP